jgi:hypothetical protein
LKTHYDIKINRELITVQSIDLYGGKSMILNKDSVIIL